MHPVSVVKQCVILLRSYSDPSAILVNFMRSWFWSRCFRVGKELKPERSSETTYPFIILKGGSGNQGGAAGEGGAGEHQFQAFQATLF